MAATKGKVKVVDSTLRDGSHAIAHQFTTEQVSKISAGLDGTGVLAFEVSHGDGMAGSSYNYGLSLEPEESLLRAATQNARHAKVAVLLVPGIGTQEDLKMAYDLGARMARIATHCTEADIAIQHIGLARDMGMETIGFLMLAHMIPPERFLENAKIMEAAGAQCVYVVDSAGHMRPDDVKRKIATLKNSLKIEVGIHAHNNLGLAIGNSLAALEEGATYLDGCMGGMGAGAGNCPTEVVAAALELEGWETGVDVLKAMDVAEDVVRPVMRRPQIIDRAGLTLGYAGVYSSFLLHTYRAAEKFGVDAREILLELGRRKVVGGQEDYIIDLAADMAKRAKETPPPKS
jgi:4-hydroxy 2-oxovalerate aldolase